MVGVALKETKVPAQTLVLLAEILIAGETGFETAIVIGLDVPLLPLKQGAFEVITQVITSLLAKPELE